MLLNISLFFSSYLHFGERKKSTFNVAVSIIHNLHICGHFEERNPSTRLTAKSTECMVT